MSYQQALKNANDIRNQAIPCDKELVRILRERARVDEINRKELADRYTELLDISQRLYDLLDAEGFSIKTEKALSDFQAFKSREDKTKEGK